MLVYWMDGFGNEHATPLRASFVAHDGTQWVVTDHPRAQFRPVMMQVDETVQVRHRLLPR